MNETREIADSLKEYREISKVITENLELSTNKQKLFNTTFEEIVKNHGGLPNFLFELFDHLENKCLEQEGIFRVGGNAFKVDSIQSTLENGLEMIWDEYDTPSLCSFIKKWFSSLEDSILPKKVLDEWMRLGENTSWNEETLKSCKESLRHFPIDNLIIIQRVFYLCKKITAKKSINKMDASNLAIVLAPTICFSKNNKSFTTEDPKKMINMTKYANLTFKFIIEHYDFIFDNRFFEKDTISLYETNPFSIVKQNHDNLSSQHDFVKSEKSNKFPLNLLKKRPSTPETKSTVHRGSLQLPKKSLNRKSISIPENNNIKSTILIRIDKSQGLSFRKCFVKIGFDVECAEYISPKTSPVMTNISAMEQGLNMHKFDQILNVHVIKPFPKNLSGNIIFYVYKSKKRLGINSPSNATSKDKSILMCKGKLAIRNLLKSDKFNVIIPLEQDIQETLSSRYNFLPTEYSTPFFSSSLIVDVLYQDVNSSRFLDAINQNNLDLCQRYLSFGYHPNTLFQNNETPASKKKNYYNKKYTHKKNFRYFRKKWKFNDAPSF